jgi:peroxiredoxin
VSKVEIGRELPSQLLDAVVLDADGHEQPLRRLVSAATLLVFLRHFGCVGCSQQVDALVPYLEELQQLAVRVVLVGNGEPRYIRGFIERQRLEGHPVELVTDPTLRSHEAAGFGQSVWATIGPRSLWFHIAAMGRGYFLGRHQGYAYQQGGVVLVAADGKLVFRHASRSAPEPVPGAVILEAVLRQTRSDADRKGVV